MSGAGESLLPPSDAAAHVVVDDLESVVLTDDAHHHLVRVRRLRAGTSCTATDGAGSWRRCALTARGLEPSGEIVRVPAPTPPVTIAFALTKGDKPETVIQKLTELGVDRIVPFRADHSVVRWDHDKAVAQHARWVVIARSAVEQSRRVRLPAIDPIADVDSVVGLGAARLDRGGPPPSLARNVLAVGPEGGWSADERDRLPSVVGIGENVLRAETAALTAGGILCALRSGTVRERPDFSTERGK